MVARAEAKYIRISPYKIRLVIEHLNGLPTTQALGILKSLNKKASLLVEKVLKSAISNAKNKGYQEDKLFISRLVANPGPVFKRYRAASFGRAARINKRTSHIIIELDAPKDLAGQTKAK